MRCRCWHTAASTAAIGGVSPTCIHESTVCSKPATAARFQAFLKARGRTAVAITGQDDPFADYGTVVLRRSEDRRV